MSALGKRWLAALTLGAGDGLTDTDWKLLNASGTTHLMVISGLHVGMVATLMLWLLRRLARCFAPMHGVWPRGRGQGRRWRHSPTPVLPASRHPRCVPR